MDSVLIIDDEKNIRALLLRVLAEERLDVRTAASAAEGLQAADDLDPDVILLDLRLPDANGLDVLKTLRARHPQAAVLMVTAFGQVESAVEAMKGGAADYIEKPFQALDKLRLAVARALQEVKARREILRLHAQQGSKYGVEQLVGQSAEMKRLRDVVTHLARSEAQTILLLGESGTGKELVAKGLHYGGGRNEMPFVEVNCAAITETLFESELFGHEKGAFTDARSAKKGLLELADRGTLFLDEVSEMSLGSQAKFLRVLQDRVFRRVGGTRDIRVDVRIVAATNRPLDAFVKEGRFREDLFYRLNVIPLTLPPLRDRPEDVVPLARHFLAECNAAFHKSIKSLSAEAEAQLASYHWPGNVRELKNLIERVVILATSDRIDVGYLPPPVGGRTAGPAAALGPDGLRTLEEVERAYILQVIDRLAGNKSRAAQVLGISRQTLRRKVHQA
ncbi:MAG TPA: sigma-54 dependent transcriptional regulator [Vicinamibacteria bacterium]|nr:sigma-54 dependent transcriptional regulator [Vicinamibacteria bacterium]